MSAKHGLTIIGYRPPKDWEIHLWVGDPGMLTCPTCEQQTHTLLRREGVMTTVGIEVRCDRCVPGLQAVA